MKQLILWLLAFFSNLGMMQTLRLLKNQRGETVLEDEEGHVPDDDPPGDATEQDDDIIEDLDDVLLEDEEDATTPDETEEEEVEEEEEEDEQALSEVQEQVKKESEHLQNLKDSIKAEQTRLHSIRQEKQEAKAGDEETPLTDAQLMGILEEHKDDPATMLNVIKYVSKQRDAEVIDSAEISRSKKEIDTALTQNFPDLAINDSELRTNIDSVKKTLRCDDHPYGDLFGVAVSIYRDLDVIRKEAFEAGKNEALGVKANDKRVKGIKEKKLAPKGKGSKQKEEGSLTSDQVETAKRIFGPKVTKGQQKLYATMLSTNPQKGDEE
jgi:hypothetical protein